ncbi:toprim domain-containing protein [Paracoccaceae bacterium]|nr:toprim domain-containing protein [Paracoccaceae bacterium]
MMTAEILCTQLGGRWYGRYGAAPCPVCQPERHKGQNALTISDGFSSLLANCKKAGCSFQQIAAASGLIQGTFKARSTSDIARRKAQEQANAAKRIWQAKLVWSEALPIDGSIADHYLRQRGITCELPDTLRFHPHCWHLTGKRLPAIVAVIDGAAGFAVHRSYLEPDGSGKAQVEPAKAMLGSAHGGAVKLTEAHGPLVVAEGVETALSLSCGLLNKAASVWAALSTAGVQGLRLPINPSELIIASDADVAGRKAAHTLAVRADGLGWKVSLLPAPNGQDWNDVLNEKGVVA